MDRQSQFPTPCNLVRQFGTYKVATRSVSIALALFNLGVLEEEDSIVFLALHFTGGVRGVCASIGLKIGIY